ncbi:hypothetical protein [Pectobacterium carotovorum]|uniref:Uncharacterized protein n=1 Tax=Pectobacterium carotovorum TaxID=554 RepID=A0A419AR49_PECCA|nr:hypothetical protein [Pectobacterium carotovorum]RJL46790.1 hypothetical protein D5071_20220 [Pectobacterium carotovorum]
MYEIQDDSVNQALFCALTDRCILNLSGNNSAVPVILFFPRSQSNTREKRASIERSQQLENIAYQKYLADNCHIRTKTNQGVVVGDNILATGEMVRNPIRAAAEKLYRYGMGGHEMPEWLVRFTEGVNMGCDIVLGMMSMGAWPIIKYSSAKALSVSGHAINGDITCLKNEFSAEELARLLFDTEVGITDRYAFHSFPVRPTRPIHPNPSELKNVRPFVPDGLFVHENAANNLNTVKYMTINHQGKEYIIREKLPGEYWAFHPHAVKPDLIEKKIYFDAINNKIHFNSDIPDGQGLDYNIIEGKKFIQLNDENHEITWNWSNNNLEVALYKKNGETLNVPVYMEPLSKKWHLSTHNTHPAFRRKQGKIIERIRITKNDNYNYFTEKNNNPKYYGTGVIYRDQIHGDNTNYSQGKYIEMKGELVPVRSRITPEHGVSYEIYNSNFPLKKGWPIEWDGARWLFERPTSVHVSRKLKQYITPDMFDKNVDASTLSFPDHIGLRYSADNKKYIKVKSHYVEIENRDGFYFIRKNNREPVYLQVEKDKFLLENFQHCIHRLKKYGLGGINLRPSQLISDKLKISEEDAVKLLREYTFPQESTLYTEGTFALWIKNFGNVPDWAADFSKIDFSAYISRFRNGEVINNQLVRFSDSDGYFYRADSTPPEEILSSGFRTSNDYTAIKK